MCDKPCFTVFLTHEKQITSCNGNICHISKLIDCLDSPSTQKGTKISDDMKVIHTPIACLIRYTCFTWHRHHNMVAKCIE